MVWYAHLFKDLPQFAVIHTVKGFGIVNKVDVFLEFSCFYYDPSDVGFLNQKNLMDRGAWWAIVLGLTKE